MLRSLQEKYKSGNKTCQVGFANLISEIANMRIGDRIRRRRAELGFTQKDLGDRAGGIPDSHISKIENGEITRLQKKTALKLAAALDWTEDDLLGIRRSTSASEERYLEIVETFDRLSNNDRQRFVDFLSSSAARESDDRLPFPLTSSAGKNGAFGPDWYIPREDFAETDYSYPATSRDSVLVAEVISDQFAPIINKGTEIEIDVSIRVPLPGQIVAAHSIDYGSAVGVLRVVNGQLVLYRPNGSVEMIEIRPQRVLLQGIVRPIKAA